MTGIILGLVAVALLGWLLRELWRPIGERARMTREARAKERIIQGRVESAFDALGTTPERPIEVTSASVVESQAAAQACVVCDSPVHVEDHAVERHDDEPLRVVALHCRRCGHRRPLYVRIKSELLH